jgi:hypothetical protein
MIQPAGAQATLSALRFELPGAGRALFTTRAHGNLSTLRGVGHEQGRAARERLCEELGLEWLCASRQVHGTAVRRVRTQEGRAGRAPIGGTGRPAIDADGHATALSGVGAMVLVADCLPVVLGAREPSQPCTPAGGARRGGARGGGACAARRRREAPASSAPAPDPAAEVGEEVRAFGDAHRRGVT